MKRNEFTKTYNRPAPVEGLPESPELERAVLGALTLEPEQLPDVAEIIEISTFSDANNGKIYGEMLSMLERGEKSTSTRFRSARNSKAGRWSDTWQS